MHCFGSSQAEYISAGTEGRGFLLHCSQSRLSHAMDQSMVVPIRESSSTAGPSPCGRPLVSKPPTPAQNLLCIKSYSNPLTKRGEERDV